MKKDLWLGMVCGMALLLGACAVNIPSQDPETTVAVFSETTLPQAEEPELTEQEKAIAQCRAVLDQVQSGTSYIITLKRWYGGVWDRTQEITYYRSGDHRAITTRSSGDDHDGEYVNWFSESRKVSIGGKVYSGYALTGDPMEWEGPLTNEILSFDPWMYTFDWDAQKVELQEIRKTQEGRCISFRVEGTYPNDRVLSEYYTISFYFDEEGNFLERELIASGVEQSFLLTEGEMIPSGKPAESGVNITRVDHVTVESLDPDVCAKTIDAIYQEALAYFNRNP